MWVSRQSEFVAHSGWPCTIKENALKASLNVTRLLIFSTWFAETIDTANESGRAHTGNTFLSIPAIIYLTFLISNARVIGATGILTPFLDAHQAIGTIPVNSAFRLRKLNG